jgi:hypothetical protein
MLQSLMEKLASLEAAAVESAAKIETSEHQITVLTESHNATVAFVHSSQEQVATLTAEREQERQQALDEKFALEAELVSARDRLAALAASGAQVDEQKAELRELTRRLEKQRLESIELAAQLLAAQQQIRELSVNVAEARLQAKFAMAGHASAARAMSSGEAPALPESDAAEQG